MSGEHCVQWQVHLRLLLDMGAQASLLASAKRIAAQLAGERKRVRERGRMRAIKFLAVVGVVSGKCCCCSSAAAAAGAHLMRRYFLRLPPAKRLACLPACTTRQPLQHSNSSSTELKQGDQVENERAREKKRERKRSAAIRGQE